jgi:hypothetical protein
VGGRRGGCRRDEAPFEGYGLAWWWSVHFAPRCARVRVPPERSPDFSLSLPLSTATSPAAAQDMRPSHGLECWFTNATRGGRQHQHPPLP